MERIVRIEVQRQPAPSVPGSRFARWKQRQHGVLFLITLGVFVWAVLDPAGFAAFAGAPLLDGRNATYARTGLAGVAFMVTFILRGQPWWHTLIGFGITVGYGGQVARGLFSPEVTTMTVSQAVLNSAVTGYLLVIGIRPSVYELLEEQRDLQAELATVNEQLERSYLLEKEKRELLEVAAASRDGGQPVRVDRTGGP